MMAGISASLVISSLPSPMMSMSVLDGGRAALQRVGRCLSRGLGLRLVLQLPRHLAVDAVQLRTLPLTGLAEDDGGHDAQRQPRIPQLGQRQPQHAGGQDAQPHADLGVMSPHGVVDALLFSDGGGLFQLCQTQTQPQQGQRRQGDEEVIGVGLDKLDHFLHTVLLFRHHGV